MIPVILAIFAIKTLLYWTFFGGASTWERPPRAEASWRAFWAAATRAALGLLAGIPLALSLNASASNSVSLTLFTLFRFVCWFGVACAFFRNLPWHRIVLFAALATAANVMLDLILPIRGYNGYGGGLC